MGALAALASQVLSAVTSQVGSYFDASKGSMPARQYIVPSTAFVLACIGLTMVLLGPALPGALWNDQPNVVKLLVTGLLVIFFVVVTEASRNLAQLVRRLYAGTWPSWSWWQQMLRQQHLRRRLSRNTQVVDLERAFEQFEQVRKAINIKPRPSGMDNPPAATAPEDYQVPVPRWTLTPFRPISADDLELVSVSSKDPKAVTSMVELVGRYAVAPLPAATPIGRDQLRTPPDPELLNDHGRVIVPIEFRGTDNTAHLQPGAVATLQVGARDVETNLLVLDRHSDTQLVLSVPREAVPEVVRAARDTSGAFVVHPAEQASHFAVLPTAAHELEPGRLIQSGDIKWQARTSDEPVRPPVTEADVVGRVFWPAEPVGEERHALAAGQELKAADLMPVANPDWFAQRKPARALAVRSDQPIRVKDVVRLEDGAGLVIDHCFVFEVQTDGCWLAVPRETGALPPGLAASTHTSMPVLVGRVDPSQLIHPDQVVSVTGKRLAEVPLGSCLQPRQVWHHWLNGERWLEPEAPIPGSALVSAFPAQAIDVRLLESVDKRRRIVYADGRRPTYGDLVTVRLMRHEQELWRGERLFVMPSEPGVLAIKLPQPPCDLDPHSACLPSDTTAEVRVTHSDRLAQREWQNLRKRLKRESDLPHFNAAMSDHEVRVERFCRRALVLDDLARQIKKQMAALEERPWSSSDECSTAFIKADYTRMLLELDGLTAMWLDLVRRVQENIEKAMLVNLPRDPSDVRPTALGNVLAASVGYPWRAYGIDTATILPMLLTVLRGDEAAVRRFRAADASLDLLLLLSFWASVWSVLCVLVGGLGFMFVSTSGQWVFPLMGAAGVLFAWVMREAAVAQAYAYGDAGKVLFDLHRHELLAHLGLVVEPELAPDEESTQYWQPLYRLFAFGEHYKGMRLKTTAAAHEGNS